VSYPPPPATLAGPARAPRLRWLERVLAMLAGGVLLALLTTAAWLTPSAQGMGTHQQLGLPPCTSVQWFGIRCPSCGMTTSWSHLVRGNVLSAFRVNAGGALLGAVALVCSPWLLVSAVRGRWLLAPPHEGVTLAVGLTIVVVTVIDWALRVSFGW
jgi:hypothetical protein